MRNSKGVRFCGSAVRMGVLTSCALLVLGCGIARASFGVAPGSFVASWSSSTQAGAHGDLGLAFAFNTHPDPVTEVAPDDNAKSIVVQLPAGLIGNPQATPRCSAAFLKANTYCPSDTQVGVIRYALPRFVEPPFHVGVPIYNMLPETGHVAELGFLNLAPVTPEVHIVASVRTGGDYGVTTEIPSLPGNLKTTEASVEIWGVPADPSHDSERGSYTDPAGGCLAENGSSLGSCVSHAPPRAFLSNPTQCETAGSLSLTVDSYQNPGVFLQPLLSEPTLMTGCANLTFEPSLSITPDSERGDSPTGLAVDLRVPQHEAASELAAPQVRKITVTLPQGMVVNPASAGGLGSCSPAQIDLHGAGPAACPADSKIAAVEARTPLLEDALVGGVYVASQGDNPFGSLLALYLVLEDLERGVVVKLAGNTTLDPVTGQITASFDEVPQQPVADVRLHFKSGSRAPLVNPASCGQYSSQAQIASWDEALAPVPANSSFQVSSAADGGACKAQGFSPGFVAGTSNPQAGGFSPFTLSLSRGDGEQAPAGLSVSTPPGLEAILKGVERCPEPQAAQGTCGEGSLIGHASTSVGAGPEPFTVEGGRVYLTGPYAGAPFGLSIVVPAKAGPFDLGTVVVRARIEVDPHTAQITVISDPFPQILQGIPLHIRTVSVAIDRQGFIFNPTNCGALAVNATGTGVQGTTAGVSSRFQAVNCAALPFHPGFSVSTLARTSRSAGASLSVHVTSGAGQANIGRVVVSLPKQLPSWLPTLQKACVDSVFDANPALCPAGSIVGSASARTPILAGALAGPAYLVSHGGAAFPDLEVVLQGEGITLDLDGATSIRGKVTTSSFNTVPDAPISSFDLSLPEGPHHVLAAVLPAKAKGSLCAQTLTMPTSITGQNGAVIKQSTKIAVTGCAKPKKKAKQKKHKAAGHGKGRKGRKG